MAARILYALSLPERTVRSRSALGGGLLREVSQLALPPAFATPRFTEQRRAWGSAS